MLSLERRDSAAKGAHQRVGAQRREPSQLGREKGLAERTCREEHCGERAQGRRGAQWSEERSVVDRRSSAESRGSLELKGAPKRLGDRQRVGAW